MNLKLKFLSREKEIQLYCFLVKTLFKIKSYTYWCRNINYPKVPCVFALWHGQQCSLYSLDDREKTHVMISKSKDGEIITKATEAMGLKVIRGSQSRGGFSAASEMIEILKNRNYGAITIDGPRGPKKIVKKGVVEIARLSGVPIVPMVWHSPSKFFVKFKTWDEFIFPFFALQMAAMYGDPIYVPYNANDDEIEKIRKRVEDKLNELYENIQNNFYELHKIGAKMKDK